MDLLARAIIAAVVVIAILLVAYYALSGSVFSHITQSQAQTLVQEDLQSTYPKATIAVTSDTPSNYSGSWHIVTDVILNSTSPCPSFFVYSYDYPKFGFQYTIVNTYTNNCVIYGQADNNTIGNFAVAITRASSYLNISSVKSYISRFGPSVTASAQSLSSYNTAGKNYTGVWLVNFSSSETNYNVYVLLSRLNGSLLSAYNLTRS